MILQQQRCLLSLCCVSCALGLLREGSGEGRGEGEGWLDRAVSFHRGRFLNDVREVAPLHIQVSLEPAPAGYVDSSAWDYAAVSRLLALVGASPHCRAQRRALRRALRPRLAAHARRFISEHDSWKLFPSLSQDHPNEIYYDSQPSSSSEEVKEPYGDKGEWWPQHDDAIVVLQNPVESRLPSAQISIKLLREILEARALAARHMPSTARSTIPWITTNKTSTPGSSNDANSDGTSSADGATVRHAPSDASTDKAMTNDEPVDKVTGTDAPADSTNPSKDITPTSNETPDKEAHESLKGAVDANEHANSRVRRARPKG